MRLKLTDKIRKFFGQAEQPDGEDGDMPSYGGSLEASVANLAAIKPSAARREAVQQHLMPQTAQQRHGVSPAGLQDQQAYLGSTVAAAAAGAGGAADKAVAHVQLQLGQHHGSQQLPSCTNSQQKDAKEFAGGLRTTGQDESYTLQSEVYFPQLLLTLKGGTPEQKAVAAEALFNYTAESDAARQRATQAGVVAHLVDLLRSGTEHGKMYAAYTLSSLTTIDESLEQMHKHGAIPALIDILSTCPLLVCKKGAMRALGRLARSDEAAQEIVAVGGLGPIIALLSRPDSSLVRRCLIALYFIGADKDSLQQAIGAAGALPQLLLLARSDSPDVQAEATDVLKVLCRNGTCGRMLAELNGIEVLVAVTAAGLTSRAKAAATRALQRLQDIPELKDALPASTARDLQHDPNMSPAHNSKVNSSTAAPAAAAALAAAAAAGPAMHLPGASPCMQRSPVQTAHAVGVSGGPAGAGSNPGFAIGGSEPQDLKQLAQVLASGNSRWLREKAAAAVEQLATDNPVACRDLAGLGVLPALLDMLNAANSSSTRRAAARALGQLSDDAVMLVHMADAGVVANLLLAVPHLAGSAQAGVMRVLHSLASVPNAITTCFQRQQTVHSMMQILNSAAVAANSSSPAAAAAAAAAEAAAAAQQQRSTMSGGSSGGSAQAGPDAGVSSRALEVLLSVCRADEAALKEIKDYPGGFKLLVSQLQHGPRSTASLVLQLLSALAQHKAHQEDLLKCGVVPTLLTLYRSDDSTVALQAARIMEALSGPASSILQRSLSAGNIRMADSSSSGSSSCGNAPTAAAAAAGAGAQPSPLGHHQQQQGSEQGVLIASSSGGSTSTDYGTCTSYSSSSIGGCADPHLGPHQSEPAMSPLGPGQKVSGGRLPPLSPRQPGGPVVEPSSLGRLSGSMPVGSSEPSSSPAAGAAPATEPAPSPPAAADASGRASPSHDRQVPSSPGVPSVSVTVGAASSSRNSSSPPRRVVAVAAALEAAAGMATAAASADGAQPASPAAAARGPRASGIPTLSRAGSKTPAGLAGVTPLQAVVAAKRPGSGKAEQQQGCEAVGSSQPQQPQAAQQALQVMQEHREQQHQPSPSHASAVQHQQHQQQQQQDDALHQDAKQQQRVQQQQQMPSRLPRRLPQAPGGSSSSSSPGSSSPGPDCSSGGSSSRTTTPDPMRRRQHLPSAAAAAKLPPGSPSSSPSPSGRGSPSASAVHLRVLAAQKQSQKNMSGSGAPADGSTDATTAAAVSLGGGAQQQQQQQQQACEQAAGTGRVMQVAAAIVANAEAEAARSGSPSRLAKQPSPPQAQLQQHLAQQLPQQQQQQQQENLAGQNPPAAVAPPAATDAAAAAAAAAGKGSAAGAPAQAGSPGSSRPAASGKGDGASAAAAAASAPAGGSSSSSNAAAQQPPSKAALPGPDKAGGVAVFAAVPPAAADADDLLSSTYDNLHGLLLKKGDIQICRTAEGRKCRLGEGGFGVVYKAVMNGVDEVAVKLVKAETPSRKELELFLKEVQTLAKLHHRNIVQFYGACLEMGSMFFVTELMKGGDLYSALRHHSETMKWERLGRKVALDVALGLNYLHAQRPPMMHRDLKSPNVLLSEEGVAKIADVGMVRSQVKDLVTAQPVMTPLWAAPEVVRHERASIKADIWSYGILIWELITGEDITEYQPLSISRQVGPSPNAKAMALPARCPAVACKLFVACTQMDPERRPQAQQLVEWLRADIASSRG